MGLDLQKQFGTDSALEADGKWFNVGDGCELLIARENNAAYRKELARLIQPHRAAARVGTLKPEVLDPILTRAIARHILKGWKELYISGKPVGAYTPEKAEEILGDFPDFRELVSELAGQREAYLTEEVEEGKGTSGK